MAHIGNNVEYALHCLLWLVDPLEGNAPSSRDLADLQGVPAAYLAKILPKLEKAGLLAASEGIHGGYRLAKAAERISVLDVIDALDGGKPLFDCQEVRGKCALFGDRPPGWATQGVCGIHAVMLRAEKAMRAELASATLADLGATVYRKSPASFSDEVREWLDDRVAARQESRMSAIRNRRAKEN